MRIGCVVPDFAHRIVHDGRQLILVGLKVLGVRSDWIPAPSVADGRTAGTQWRLLLG